MRTIWFKLAWKEWHEHKWKLASLVATLWSVTALMLLDQDRNVFAGVRVILALCIVPLAVFIGLGTAAGERSRGTLPFLQALPVPMWRVALNKLFFGLATIVGAALLTLAFVYAWCEFRGFGGTDYGTAAGPGVFDPFSFGTGNWFGDTALAMLCVAGSFYIWTAACGVNRRDEVSAGAVALLVIVIWTVLISYGISFGANRSVWTGFAAMAVSTAPGGLITATELGADTDQFLGIAVIAAAFTHFALIAWYVGRFGRITNLEVRSPQVVKRTAVQIDWLGPPRRSALSAVVWKQCRESGPIVLAGLAGTIGIVAMAQLTEWWEYGVTTRFGEVYNVVAAVLGFVMALVIGIGVCFYDVQPQLNFFWRSRPIHPDLWFWCKYFTGLTVFMTAVYAPMLLIAALGDRSGFYQLNHPDGYAYTLPIAHIAVFASAVAMTCLVRHAVYAAILSIAFMYLGVLAAYAAWIVVILFGWDWSNRRIWWEPTLAQSATGLITSIIISTLIAWLAMRYDWGRKSRY